MIKNILIGILSLIILAEGYFMYSFKTDMDKMNSELKEISIKYSAEMEKIKEEEKKKADFVHFGVPFVAQAPLSNWMDPKQAYGCEEASVLMAIAWAKKQGLAPEKAVKEIVDMSNYQLEKFKNFYDTSIQDTYDRLILGYFNYKNSQVRVSPTIEDIKSSLKSGDLVIAPVNGRILANKHYTPPGPFLHTLLIIGYDNLTQEFITHDPGTTYGASARYSYEKMASALQDYETGFNEPVKEVASIIIISPEKR